MLRTALALMLALPGAAGADEFRSLSGHGGPVMDIAVSADGLTALTASFDYSVGLWDLGSGDPRWLDGHDAAVNAVTFLQDGRAVSGGDDFAVILWDVAAGTPLRRMEGHKGKVMAVEPSPDGSRIASASWDGTIRIWDTETGASLAELTGHDGNVNDVLWADGGQTLYSAGYDGTIIEWETNGWTQARTVVRHGFGINELQIDEQRGWLAYGALDGGTRALDLDTGEELADLTADRRPILALSKSPRGDRLAVGDGEGYIMVVGTDDWTIIRDFRAAVNGPIWALAFTKSGEGVFAAGISDEAFLWPLDAEDSAPRMAEMKRKFHTDPDLVSNGERQFLRKCSVCHTLGADGERRAGPPLHGLFGREAGSVDGYTYSQAMENSTIVWSEQTIDKLFDLGPDHYTPGSKMPMQRIASSRDRADLIAFLKAQTGPDIQE